MAVTVERYWKNGAAVSWGVGRVDVFVPGPAVPMAASSSGPAGLTRRCVYTWLDHGTKAGANVGALQDIGGNVTSRLCAVSFHPGVIHVVAKGADEACWVKTYLGNEWSKWTSLGGRLNGPPTAITWGMHRVDVFARSPDNKLMHKAWMGVEWEAKWTVHGGALPTPDVTACSWGYNRMDVFVPGADGAVWHYFFDQGSWHGWKSLGGTGVLSIDAMSVRDNTMELVAVFADKCVYHRSYKTGKGWTPWFNVGGAATSRVRLISMDEGRQAVFLRGADNAVYMRMFENGSWKSGFQNLGGQSVTDPIVASHGVGHISVFVQGADGQLYHKMMYKGVWGAWTVVPGGKVDLM